MASHNKYTQAHLNPSGPGDARPTALQIVQDEGLEGRLGDKIMLVTGTSSGIGPRTVEALAATGATVYAAARDRSKNTAALADIKGNVKLLDLDLSSFASIRAAADDFLKQSGGKLNILVNNAGVMAIAEQTFTSDGYEMQFGTNHLGHFLLFQLLKSALLESSTPEFPSRVVNLTSVGHRISGIHFGNLNLDGEYSPWVAYGQAKTANIMMTNYIERHYSAQGLHGLAVHPGGIMTPLQRHLPQAQRYQWNENLDYDAGMKSPEQGASTTVLAAIGEEIKGKGRLYLEDCGVWGQAQEGAPIDIKNRGYAPHAFDANSEDKLWVESSRIVGVSE
jgi:NAD(P)-dependent dehydrogenase (short-subunit alcohol dehydrogenase family)